LNTSFSGCLPFCVKIVLCYCCLLSLWQNKYDDDDEYCHKVCYKKLEWCGDPMVKKFEDIFTHIDTIHERDGHRTDGQTAQDGVGRRAYA